MLCIVVPSGLAFISVRFHECGLNFVMDECS